MFQLLLLARSYMEVLVFYVNIVISGVEDWIIIFRSQVPTAESQWINWAFRHIMVKWLFRSFVHFFLLNCLSFTYWFVGALHKLWIQDCISQVCITKMKYLRQLTHKEKWFIQLTVLEIQGHGISICSVLVSSPTTSAVSHHGRVKCTCVEEFISLKQEVNKDTERLESKVLSKNMH